MRKKLAIKGHPTRGEEVINLLEMLGGKNCYNFSGVEGYAYYVIEGYQKEIRAGEYIFGDEDKYFFTLEEFFEKYPFKVGDKVYIKVDPNANCLGSEKIYGVIESAVWVEKFGYVVYNLKGCSGTFNRDELHPYKEEVSLKDGKVIDNLIDASQFKQIIGKTIAVCFNTEYFENEVELKLGDYEIVVRDGKTYAVKKKPKYPTTYEECNRIMCVEHWNTLWGEDATEYEEQTENLINALIRLKICRDAYWKIAGEEMGLGKPWEPNWTTFEGMPAIFRFRYNIVCDSIKNQHCLLVFPTEEMRDTFYKNFKDLIEQCKELL